MSKRFDIHEWQAKQRLSEEDNPVVAKGDGLEITQDEMEKLHKNGRVKLKNGSVLVYMKEENVNEHHAGDYKPGFLKQSVNTFLDKLKKKTKEGKDYKIVEKIMEKYFSAKKKNEASATGTGASITTGASAAYATPKAFGDNKRKKKKGYMGYKEI